jgi:transposase-like protein
LFGEDGLIKALTSRILDKALQAEMENHPGYQNPRGGGKGGTGRFPPSIPSYILMCCG